MHADGGPLRSRVAIGALGDLLCCPRRFACHLSDAPSMRMNDGRLRLRSAVEQALLAAHDRWATESELARVERRHPPALDELLDATPPDGLGTEEQHRFREAVAAYGDAFADDEVLADPRSLASLDPRPTRDGAFDLTGRAPLLVRGHDGVVEARRIVIGPARRAASVGDRDIGLAVLLRVDALRITTLHTHDGEVLHAHVTEEHVAQLRTRLRDATDAARNAPVARPGWWCTQCPAIRGCDAVAQGSIGDVLGMGG